MIATPTEYKHIVLDEDGVPLIEGTTMKVRELILEHLAHGWSSEELHWQHPYLNLAQIHAAFSYYYDHQEQMDEDMQARWEQSVDARARAQAASPLYAKLRELKKSRR